MYTNVGTDVSWEVSTYIFSRITLQPSILSHMAENWNIHPRIYSGLPRNIYAVLNSPRKHFHSGKDIKFCTHKNTKNYYNFVHFNVETGHLKFNKCY